MRKKFLKKILNLFAVSIVALVPLSPAWAVTTVGNNVSVGGTLGVTGVTTLTGAAVLSSTLGVTGLSTFTGGFISTVSSSIAGGLSVNGNLSASSTLTVAGAATLSSTLGVTSLATLSGGFISTVSSSIAGGLSVNGNLSASSTVTVGGVVRPNNNNTIDVGAYALAFKNIYASSSLFAASSTIQNAVTSTVLITSTGNTYGGQIVFKAANGANCYALYFGATEAAGPIGLATSTVTCPNN